MVIANAFTLPMFQTLGTFLPLDSLLSTQGIMVALLVAYAGQCGCF
jgi:Na+-translocating ferredoxin:NAD+ oxidoreductase RnfE subunit